MPVQKLKTVDAFVLTDFADVPASGYVRRARKILQSSTWDLARSATYTFATFELQHGGASAGINAVDETTTEAVAAFRTELATEAADGRLTLLDGKGVPRSDDGQGDTDAALAATVSASVEQALGGTMDGCTIAVEGQAAAPTALCDQLTSAGAQLVDVDGVDAKPWMLWAADVDAILVGSKPGVLNHQGAEMLKAKAVVPWGPTPITTKALAVMIKSGVTYVPDFVAASGPLLTGTSPDRSPADLADDIKALLGELSADATANDEPLFLAACRRAESFLTSWQAALPFGRPLAG